MLLEAVGCWKWDGRMRSQCRCMTRRTMGCSLQRCVYLCVCMCMCTRMSVLVWYCMSMISSRMWLNVFRSNVCMCGSNHPNLCLSVSQNLRLDTVIQRDFFDVLDSSLNGSYFLVRPLKSGRPSLASSFNKLVDPDNGSTITLSSTLTQQQPVEVYDPVVVEPSPVVLLWDPAESNDRGGSEKYSYQMKVG